MSANVRCGFKAFLYATKMNEQEIKSNVTSNIFLGIVKNYMLLQTEDSIIIFQLFVCE